MIAEPTDPISALRASHDRLQRIVGMLTPAQLGQPGYPSDWSVAQVLSHLGSGAEIYTMILAAGLAGAEPPPREAYPLVWDRWNGKSPEEQAADAVEADANLVRQIEDNADSAATFMIFSGPTDLFGLARARLSESVAHTWDIAVTVDPTAALLPQAVPILIGYITPLLGFLAKPSGWTGSIQVTTSEPTDQYALTLGQTATLAPWSFEDQAAANLELPAEAFLRLLYGRLDASHTPANMVKGITLDDLRSVFQGF